MNEAEDNSQGMTNSHFTLEHFKDTLEKLAKPGLVRKFTLLMPGMGDIRKLIDSQDTTGEMQKMIGLVNAMTPTERRNPTLVDDSRRKRISRGAGVAPAMCTHLITQFTRMLPIMQLMAGTQGDRMTMLKQSQQSMMQDPTLGGIKFKRWRRDQ